MERVMLGHGSGGRLMHDLVEEYFIAAFGMKEMGDSALVGRLEGRIALTCDSYVVSPLFFPGGNIGSLAVNGTVNDLSMAGAVPKYLTAGFILEEGFPLADLRRVVDAMAVAAEEAEVAIVTGDTKVVERGKGDGLFINTAGVGVVAEGVHISAMNIRPGDVVLVSAQVGVHGICILAERNGLAFDPPLMSDTRPLHGLVRKMCEAAQGIRFMRDPTRGGLATTLKEAAVASGTCIRIREEAVPLLPQVKGACHLLGLDPLYVASEGVLAAVVAPEDAGRVLEAMNAHPYGAGAVCIGTVEAGPKGVVLLETAMGGTRMVDMLPGEQLPRIC